MKTKPLISIITAGILGTLADINGGATPVVPVVAIATAPQPPTAPTASSPSALAPPAGLRVIVPPAATLAAIPTDSPAGYYMSGEIRGYYININSPYWATNQSYGDFVYRHTNNSVYVNASKKGTNQRPTIARLTSH